MRRRTRLRSRVVRAVARVLAALLAAAALWQPTAATAATPAEVLAVPPGAHAAFAKLPLAFEINRGQVAEPVRFLARGPGYGVLLTPHGTILALERDATRLALTHADAVDPSRSEFDGPATDRVRLRFDGANPDPLVTGHSPLRGRVNYLIGRDPSRWTTGVPTYGRVRYHSVYPGIDVDFRGSAGRLEYDLVVAPGADLSRIRLVFEGVEGLAVDAGGALILHTPGGDLRQPRPTIFQEHDGERRPIEGDFVRLDESTIGFAVAAYDATRPLVIDPVLVYSTWLGGSRSDEGLSVALDAQGHVYVAGTTSSADFPLAMPLQPRRLGDTDAFVAKLSPGSGELLFSTYIGGKNRDEVKKDKKKKKGKGKDEDDDEDTDEGKDDEDTDEGKDDDDDERDHRGGHVCHDRACDRGADLATGVAIDETGSVYLSGVTGSVADFPVVGAVQPAYGGGDSDGFVLKLSPDGGFLEFSTYLGGRDSDEALDIALDAFGDPVVAGGTESDDFPVAGAVQPFRAGKRDAFVTRLAADGSFIDFSTYFGGRKDDEARAVATDSLGDIYFAGDTRSKKDFPTTGAFQPNFGGGKHDAFVAKFAADGASVDYATFLGGKGDDSASGLAIDAKGRAWIAGTTDSKKDFPLERPVQSRYGGSSSDAFVTGLAPGGRSLAFSSYLGGKKEDRAAAIALDGAGYVYVTGYTRSRRDFPLVDPVQSSFGGAGPGGHGQPRDVFVTALAPLGAEIVYSTYLGGSGLDVGTDVASDIAGNVAITGYTRSTRDFPLVDAVQPAFGGGHDDAFVAMLGTTNLPPVITSTPGVLAQRASPYLYDVEASDPNGDVLRFTLPESPAGMTIDPATGEIVWVPDVPGDFAVTVEVDDFRAGEDTQSYVLSVNAPPLIVSAPPETVLQGREFAYDVVALDDDGDTLGYSLTVAPAGMTVDPDTGAVRWVPLVPGDYDVTVRAEDGRGGSDGQSFVVIVQPDLVAPVITIGSPPDDLATNNPSQSLSGSVDEPASVDVNGTPLPLDGSLGFGLALTLIEGTNALVVTATDPFGNTATSTVTVTLDTVAPIVTVTAPPDGTLTNDPALTIGGTVDESATLVVNGQAVTVNPDGTFSVGVTLAEGANTFALDATDDAGNVGATTLDVTLDTIAPTVTVTAPPDGTLTNDPALTIDGTVDESATLFVNGQAVVVNPDGTFLVGITLAEGANAFALGATDAAGNTGSASLGVTLDTIPPAITVLAPPDGTTVTGPAQIIVGTVDEPAALTIDGQPVVVAPDGTFAHPVTLGPGANPIALAAIDTAGNVGTASLTVTLQVGDVVPPVISNVQPPDGSVVSVPAQFIFGEIDEESTVTIDGVPALVFPNPPLGFAFISAPLTLAPGANPFLISATDPAGNTADVTITLTLDNADATPPVITITSPPDGLLTTDPNLTIAGLLSEAAALTLDGVPAPVNFDNSFAIDATLAEGENVLDLEATDLAGNVGTASLTVTLDSLAPIITIVSPVDGALTNDPGLTIAGRLDEPVPLTLDGQPLALNPALTFSAFVTLAEGGNAFTLEASDAAGNVATNTVDVTLDRSAPLITVTDPADGSVTNQPALTITGNLSETGSLALNGQPVTVLPDLTFRSQCHPRRRREHLHAQRHPDAGRRHRFRERETGQHARPGCAARADRRQARRRRSRRGLGERGCGQRGPRRRSCRAAVRRARRRGGRRAPRQLGRRGPAARAGSRRPRRRRIPRGVGEPGRRDAGGTGSPVRATFRRDWPAGGHGRTDQRFRRHARGTFGRAARDRRHRRRVARYRSSATPVTGILARLLDASGSPVGAELPVNDDMVAPLAAARIAPLAGGGFAVTWQGTAVGGDAVVAARRFDATANPLGAEFTANTATPSSPARPSAAGLVNGGFVLVWQSRAPGPGGSIAGQRFDASGAAAGAELALSVASPENHTRPDVVALASGGFVVGWETDGSIDGDGDGGIGIRRFDSDGGPLDSESAANELTLGVQTRPALAGFDDGTVIAVWETSDPASGDASATGIAARRIGVPPVTNTSALTFGVTLDTVAPVVSVAEPVDGSTVFVQSQPVSGSLSESAALTLDGAPVSVQPDLSFDTTISLVPGANTLDLVAVDAAGNAGAASVTVTLEAVPTITSAPILTAPVGEQYAYDVEASDPGANLLTFTLLDAPPGMTIGAVTGLVNWVPPAKGAFNVSVRAANAIGGSATQSYGLTVPNRAPSIVSAPPATTRFGEDFAYAVGAQDADADVLGFSLAAAPASMTIDPANGRIDWTVDLTGTADVSVRVDDGDGGIATQSFTLAIDAPNQVPVIDSTAVTTGAVDAPYQYDVNATDGDGDALVFALTTAPVGMQIDPVGGVIAWTPNVAGTFPVTVTADDGHGGTAMQAFDVDVAFSPGAQPPGLAPIGDQVVPLGTTTTLQLAASDPDGNELRFLATPLPLKKNMTLNAQSGRFTFTPALSQVGDHVLTFTASDGRFSDSETVTLTVPAPVGPTGLTGRVITTGGAPLAGVTLEIDGITVFSDANGDYFFPDLGTAAGQVRLLIDGASVDPALGTFATVPEMIPIIAGADNRLEPAIVLLPLDVASADPVVPSQTSIITSSRPTEGLEIFEPVTLTIPPGHAQLTDGTPFTGDIHISRVADPSQGPRPLPPDIDLSYYIAIQPFGVVYPVPVPISFPNVEHLPPESILDFFALNHDTGQMEKIGEGRVSLDGKTVDSIGGVVKSNSWHGIVPQAPVNSPHADDGQGNKPPGDCQKNPACRFDMQTGNLGEDHTLPSYYSLGAERRVHLSYNSLNANPRPIININSQFGNFAPPPLSMSLKLEIDGVDQGFEQFMQTNVTPSTVRGQFEPVRPAVQYEAGMLETGIHEYALIVNCHFPISRRSETLVGTTVIQNERFSAFGAGWTLAGLHRVRLHADGTVLMTQGDGTAIVFAPDPADVTGNSFFSPAGDFSVFTRLPDGTFTRRMKDGTIHSFDTAGRQVADADRNGNTTTYLYDGGDRLIRIVDPVGRAFDFTYFAGRIKSVSDPLNRVTRFVHDTEGNLVRIIEPNGDARIFEYEAQTHLLTAQRDQRDNRTEYSYDFAGRIAGALLPDGSNPLLSPGVTNGVLDPTSGTGTGKDNLAGKPSLVSEVENVFADQNGNVERTQVDALSAPVKHTDAVGRVTLNERDGDALPTETTRPNESRITRTFDALGNPTLVREEFNGAEYRYEYDSHSLVTRLTNPLGHTTTVTRDTEGNATEVINHLGHTTTYDYDNRGLVTRTASPNGLETVMAYNTKGLVARQTETPPPGSPGSVRVTDYRYDSAGQLIELFSPDGVITTFAYDTKGRMIRIVDNLGQAIDFTYDPFDNLVAREARNTDTGLALRISRAYDSRNRLAEIRAPHAGPVDSVTQRVLDNNSNITGLVDPNTNLIASRYDGEDRLVEITHRENGVTTYAYDTNDRITEVVAPNGVVTTYAYDVLGRRLTETSRDRGTVSYTYDLANNVTSITDGRGITTTFTYDDLERPLSKTFPNTIAGKVEDVTYTYDSCPFGVGNLCGRSDESGNYAFEYDAFENLTRNSFTETGGITYVTEYDYDDGDNVIRTKYPGGRIVDVTRDALRRINGVDATVDGQPQSIVSGIQYRADDQLTQCTFGNGLTDARAYDLQGRLTHQLLQTPAALAIDERSYSHDRNGNVLAIDTNVEDNVYGYDRRDRLVSDQIDAESPLDFSYDENDNRLSHSAVDLSRLSDYLFEPGTNRLSRINQFRVGPAQSVRPVRELVYNDAGRLFALYEDGFLVARFLYNDDGQRTRKTSYDSGGTEISTTVFHYDRQGYLISETTAQGAPVRDYIWLEDMVPVAQIDAASGTDTVTYLHPDHLLTPRLGTDELGQIVWRWEGEAFGNTPAQELGAISVHLRLPGQYHDEESGLHYNHFRYYDPELGRYITSDPVGLAAGENTYGYGEQNPIANDDPDGRIIPAVIVAARLGYAVYRGYKTYKKAKKVYDCWKKYKKHLDRKKRDRPRPPPNQPKKGGGDCDDKKDVWNPPTEREKEMARDADEIPLDEQVRMRQDGYVHPNEIPGGTPYTPHPSGNGWVKPAGGTGWGSNPGGGIR